MSRWDRWGWYKAAPKKPPPARGIKMKRSGTTWWGQRWIEALERMSAGYSNRLARGRSYARAGRAHDLEIKGSQVLARVTGSRSTPYKVSIKLVALPDAAWQAAIGAMAEKAQFTAELLAGQMPMEIDAAFLAAGTSLFPLKAADLTTSCSCPDWANPCKHIAATHYVLGEAFDQDPFLLFELRGRGKAQVLDALRAARAEEGAPAPGEGASPAVPSVSLEGGAADWDAPPSPLPSLRLSFESPSIQGGALRPLGAPSAWSSARSPVEVLGPMIRAAAERARGMAMAEAEPEPLELTSKRPRAPISRRAARGDAGTKRGGTKKAGSKEVASKKAARRKAGNDPAAFEQAAPKKTPAQQAATKKAAMRKAMLEQAASEQTASRQAASKKAAMRKAVLEQASPKKTPSKKVGSKKAAMRKAMLEQAALEHASKQVGSRKVGSKKVGLAPAKRRTGRSRRVGARQRRIARR